MKVLPALILLISLQANAKTMGIFSNFFGKKGALTSGTDTSGLKKTSQMLDEDIYWNLIDQAEQCRAKGHDEMVKDHTSESLAAINRKGSGKVHAGGGI